MSQRQVFSLLSAHVNRRILGQEQFIERLMIALLADGHLLVEGAPGLAKTTAIKELAAGLEGDFHRIQFTPDLLPGDITGTEIYRPQDGSFVFQRGPIFHNLILADEINRAPAKVQSALLEAMAERQTTVGSKTYPMAKMFLVMATQNPIEQEGTYRLPEAQLDRFLMHVRLSYPNVEAEREILKLAREQAKRATNENGKMKALVSQEQVFKARQEVLEVFTAPALEEYIVQLVVATRDPSPYGAEMKSWVEYGASPRATIALDRCAKAQAWLSNRDYVSPADIHAVAHDVLRHRILLTFTAEAGGVTTDKFISDLLQHVPVP